MITKEEIESLAKEAKEVICWRILKDYSDKIDNIKELKDTYIQIAKIIAEQK